MRKRTATLVELDKDQRNKFLELIRDFLVEELEIDGFDESTFIVPDVEFDQGMVNALGLAGNNPFLLDPSLVNKLLSSARYTFTWYTWEGELEDAQKGLGSGSGNAGPVPPTPWGYKEDDDDGEQIH